MNISTKGLRERKNFLIAEMEKMLDSCKTEQRAMDNVEFECYESKEKELKAINKTISELEKRSKENATVTTINAGLDNDVTEVRKAMLDVLESRAMTYSGNGSLVPEYLHAEVVKALPEVAPLFAKCDILTPVNGTVRVAVEGNIGEASFVGEDEEVAVADLTHNFVELTQHRAGSAMEITQQLINDSGIDIVKYVTDVLFRRLGEALDRAMITGDGIKGFQGLMNAPTSCKVTAKNPDEITIEDLMKVIVSMKETYSKGAVWVMNRNDFAKFAMMKDGAGHFYVVREREVENTLSYKLFGHEILVNDAADKIYFVNFHVGYKGIVKKGVNLVEVQDRASALKGIKAFVMDLFADAKIVQPEAIKYLA